MKTNSLLCFWCIFLIAVAPLVCFAAPSRTTVKNKQNELREKYDTAKKRYSTLSPEFVIQPEYWLKRRTEMENLLSRMFLPSIPRRSTATGLSLMWGPRTRMVPLATVTARDYAAGPNGSVVPFSGEFTDAANDLSGFERSGIGFELTRSYGAFSRYDCGFGIGWNFNYNAGLVVHGENLQLADQLTMFIGMRDIVFTRQDGQWLPKQGQGIFLRLEAEKDRILVYFPNLQRYEFELAGRKALAAQGDQLFDRGIFKRIFPTQFQ